MEFFADFMPHGHCYLWTPSILWTTVASDTVIALSYYSIPLALLYFVRKREDLPFSWIFLLFGVFIMACGTGHVLDVWNTWHGDYGTASLVKLVTAVASVATAVVLWPLLPRALALPSPEQLTRANESLRAEIGMREQAEGALRAQTRDLTEARDAAQAASRAKSQFLANMSHEIRTPLNAVIGFSEMLLASDLDDEQRDRLRTVVDSGEVLLNVVNDVLDYSRIEAGRVELEEVTFNLEDVLGDTLRSMAVRAERNGLELMGYIGPDVPRFLSGDPGRLRQVIANLVSNAITFTEEGEIEVRVELAGPSEGVHLRFCVRDTGMGIEPQQIQRLFESFEQADSSSTRRFGGTGLGLSICRGLVDLLGGEIGAESTPGVGSTFHFTARFQLAESPLGSDSATARCTDAKVLIVDDNASNREIMSAMARRQGLEPVLASSAAEGLAALRRAAAVEDAIPLILADLHMPEVDGFDFVQRLRADESLGDPIVILLTSTGMAPDLTRCEELRIVARILKPIKEYELAAVIARAMGREEPGGGMIRLRPLHSRSAAASEGAPDETVGGAAAPLRILLAEDSIANQKLTQAMLQPEGHAVVVARNGEEALALFRAQDFDVILMDIQMPEMDGFACTSAIRASELSGGRPVPIIAMTAHALAGDRDKCLAAGMNDYVSKPIRRQDLLAALARAMQSHVA